MHNVLNWFKGLFQDGNKGYTVLYRQGNGGLRVRYDDGSEGTIEMNHELQPLYIR